MRAPWIAILLVSLFAPACGEGGGKLPLECRDTTLPVLDLPPGATGGAPGREAAVILEERVDRIANDRAGTAKILAYDFSVYEGKAAPIDMDGENCWRVVGQPVIDVPPDPLTVGGARFEDLASGVLDVGAVTGAWASQPLPSLLGESEPRVLWSADPSAAGTFPDVDARLGLPAPLSGITTSREAIGAELLVQWEAGGATWIEIVLVTDDPSDPTNPARRNRVVCRVLDDGCQPIPAGSLDWLSLNGTSARITLERHEIRRSAPEGGTLLTLETIRSEENEVALDDGLLAGEANP